MVKDHVTMQMGIIGMSCWTSNPMLPQLPEALGIYNMDSNIKILFFPNQAALEGFLQSRLRNRIAWLGRTGSPSEILVVPRVCLSVHQ